MRNFQISIIALLIGIIILSCSLLKIDDNMYDELQLFQLNNKEYALIIKYRDKENKEIREDYKIIKNSKEIYDVEFYKNYLPTKIGSYQLENYKDQIINKKDGVRLITLYYIYIDVKGDE